MCMSVGASCDGLRLKRCEVRARHSVFLAYLGPIVEVSLISSEAFSEKLAL